MNLISGDHITYSKLDEQFKTDLSSFIQANCYNINGTTLSRPSCFIDGTVLVDSIYYEFDESKVPPNSRSIDNYSENRSLQIVIDDGVLKLSSFNMMSIINEFNTYIRINLPDVLSNKIVRTQDIVKYYHLCNYFLQKRIVRMIPPPKILDESPKPSEYTDIGYFYSNIDELDKPEQVTILEGSFSNNGVFDNYGFILNVVNDISNIRTVNCKLIKI